MSSALLAVLLAGAAGWIATALSGPARRARVLTGPPGVRGAGGRLLGAVGPWSVGLGRASPFAVGGLVGFAVLVLVASPAGALVCGGAAAAACRALRRVAADRAVRAGQERVRRLLRGLAVELRSGAPSPLALQRSWASPADPVSGTARGPGLLVADVPALLRAAADDPGQQPLRRLGALWEVADSTGAGLAPGVDRLVDQLDEERELAREVDTVLAGPRASARLMAGLPLMGLLLGTGLGADPAGFLLHDPLGQGCLLAGSGLVLAGLRWTRSLADAAGSGRGYG